MAQHGTHHQNFVFEAGDKERADRTVDQTRGQCFFLGGAGLTLEEATRYFTGGIVFFLVVHGQGEEILARLLLTCVRHVGHNAGFTQRGNHRPVRLTGNLTGFQCQRLFAPLDRFFRYIKHLRFLFGPLAIA